MEDMQIWKVSIYNKIIIFKKEKKWKVSIYNKMIIFKKEKE